MNGGEFRSAVRRKPSARTVRVLRRLSTKLYGRNESPGGACGALIRAQHCYHRLAAPQRNKIFLIAAVRGRRVKRHGRRGLAQAAQRRRRCSLWDNVRRWVTDRKKAPGPGPEAFHSNPPKNSSAETQPYAARLSSQFAIALNWWTGRNWLARVTFRPRILQQLGGNRAELAVLGACEQPSVCVLNRIARRQTVGGRAATGPAAPRESRARPCARHSGRSGWTARRIRRHWRGSPARPRRQIQ